MIPTRFKSKLPKTLSWPLGAQAISEGLADAPHVADLTLWFSDSAVWPASEFRRLLRESIPYAVLVAEYCPELRPGYTGSAMMIESGWYKAQWKIQVNPVLPELRALVGRLLREQGLPLVVEWLRSSAHAGWESRHHRMELVFAPTDETLTPQFTDGV